MKHYHHIAAMAAIAFALVFIAASPSRGELEFFPDKKIPKANYAALMRATAIGVQYIYESTKMKHYATFDFGAVIPILAVKGESLNFETGGLGGIFSRFELFSESFNYVTADFMGGGYAAIQAGGFIVDTSVYHVSSHIGDEQFLYHGGYIVNTGYEAVRVSSSWSALDWLTFSLGAEYKFGRRPAHNVFYRGSVFFEGRMDFLPLKVPLFIEGNLELVDWYRYANAGVRIGIYLRYFMNTVILQKTYQGAECHELSITYYYGFSRALYFGRNRESLVMMGPTYRF